MRLDGRIVIVTGGSSGFGRATARRVAEEGAHVVIADLDEAGGKETVTLVEEAGRDAELVVGDIATESGAVAAVARAVERFGTVDVLVNNAGIAPPEVADSWNANEDSWDRVLRINLKSVYLCSRAVIPIMIEKGSGSIVNVASIAATRACSGASYAAAKGGILGYTVQVAPELAGRGVRVNCVSPGFMHTPMSTGERHGLDPAAQAAPTSPPPSHTSRATMRGTSPARRSSSTAVSSSLPRRSPSPHERPAHAPIEHQPRDGPVRPARQSDDRRRRCRDGRHLGRRAAAQGGHRDVHDLRAIGTRRRHVVGQPVSRRRGRRRLVRVLVSVQALRLVAVSCAPG
jgi:NAD(P)-dependent dehydrogenase (short-subunit alcohol dehydrogenase family)